MKVVGVLAFGLLATALCARALLNEDRTISAGQVLAQPEGRWSASLMVRHVSHLVAAGGIGLGALWMTLSRRRWRLGGWGLEAGAAILGCAALLSVPVASDKRLAMNVAIDTILPLIAAAALYQLLAHRSMWRRALLAAVVALAAANCWKATAQKGWQYKQSWERYQQYRAQWWSQQGISLDDPEVAAYEVAARNARPMGFIRGANVLSSFLLLGLAGTGAALAGCGWWRARGDDRRTARLSKPARIAAAALVSLTVWHLVVLSWVRTAGSIVGLLAALAAGVAGLWLRDRPKRLAILLVTGLVLLQTTLVVLAVSPPRVHRALINYRGAGGKIRTLGARLPYWAGAIRFFADSPFTGIGPSQFGKRYLAARPAYSDEKPPDAHNWLLNMAAEWGVFGVLGVLIAVGGSGWCALRSLARPPDEANRPPGAALLTAMLVVLACWLMLAADLPRSQWSQTLPYPMAVSLVAAALVSFCRLHGKIGQVILLAGLVGFLVHCTAEITPSVPGAMWPFWAMVALAMAWNGHGPVSSIVETPARRRTALVGPVLAGAVALAVVGLTVRPMRAVGLMHQAQRAVVQSRPEQAVTLLRAAAAADPLDPLPLKTAAFLRHRLGQTDATRSLEHLRDSVALSHAAVRRNPLDYTFWRSLGLANMFLGCAIEDFALVDEAIRDMRQALELNPQWPEGWLELARMAAVTGGKEGDRPALLRTALQAADKALALEDGRPADVAPTLTSKDRAELLSMREQLLRRLEAATTQPAATQPSR